MFCDVPFCLHTIGMWAGCAAFTGRHVIRLTAVRSRFTWFAFSVIWTGSAMLRHLRTYGMETQGRKQCCNHSGTAYSTHKHTKHKHWALPVQGGNSTHLYYVEKTKNKTESLRIRQSYLTNLTYLRGSAYKQRCSDILCKELRPRQLPRGPRHPRDQKAITYAAGTLWQFD